MNIAIQKGLENLKDTLHGMGHNVFYIGENQVAEAVLYNESETYHHYDANKVISAVSSIGFTNAEYGALLVNVSNKTTDEIVRILNNRVYSPLF